MAKITIDDKEYETENFSKDAMDQFTSFQYTRNEITRLQLQAAAMQTASNAYIKALKDILDAEEDPTGKIEMAETISFE